MGWVVDSRDLIAMGLGLGLSLRFLSELAGELLHIVGLMSKHF